MTQQSNPNETLHASRPGKKTLVMIIGAVLLFFIIRFWSELKLAFNIG